MGRVVEPAPRSEEVTAESAQPFLWWNSFHGDTAAFMKILEIDGDTVTWRWVTNGGTQARTWKCPKQTVVDVLGVLVRFEP